MSQHSSQDMRTESPTTKAGFFTLPAELRNYTYELAILEGDDPIRLFETRAHDLSEKKQTQPGITQVNRQTHAEALPIYYTQNTFRLPCSTPREWTQCKNWLKANAKHLHLIPGIEFEFCPLHRTYWGFDVAAGKVTDWGLDFDVGGERMCSVWALLHIHWYDVRAVAEKAKRKEDFGVEEWVEIVKRCLSRIRRRGCVQSLMKLL